MGAEPAAGSVRDHMAGNTTGRRAFRDGSNGITKHGKDFDRFIRRQSRKVRNRMLSR